MTAIIRLSDAITSLNSNAKFRYLHDANDKKIDLIEIKPKAQSVPPKKKDRVTQRYLREVKRWGVNQAKWKAATETAENRGWGFKVLTEKELFKNGK